MTRIFVKDTGRVGEGFDPYSGPVWDAYRYLARHRFGDSSPPTSGLYPYIERYSGNGYFTPGMSGPTLTSPASSVVNPVNVPMTTTPLGIRQGFTTVNLAPAPEVVSSQLTAEAQEQPILYAPRPASFSRRGGGYGLTLQFQPDSILTPRMLAARDVNREQSPTNWLEYYLLFLEALATPMSILGRKPFVALQHMSSMWGVGQMALQIESVDIERQWYGPDGLARADVTIRMREFLAI